VPGYQEVLIISAIVLGVIFLPRVMAPRKPPPRLIRSKKKLSGTWRAALALSVAYPLIAAAVLQPWHANLMLYLYVGLGPVLAVWLLYWVVQGFRRR
jgi:hypothetical protein